MKSWNTKRRFLTLLFLTTVLFSCAGFSIAQPVLPQRTLTVTPTQSIHFGTICILEGGGAKFVTVDYSGFRTASSGIVLLSTAPTAQPAIFEIKLCEGRSVSITFEAAITLSSSSGGLLTLNLGPTENGLNGASFLTNSDCNFITPLRMGGTLLIPSGTVIPGVYSGSFAITFDQE